MRFEIEGSALLGRGAKRAWRRHKKWTKFARRVGLYVRWSAAGRDRELWKERILEGTWARHLRSTMTPCSCWMHWGGEPTRAELLREVAIREIYESEVS